MLKYGTESAMGQTWRAGHRSSSQHGAYEDVSFVLVSRLAPEFLPQSLHDGDSLGHSDQFPHGRGQEPRPPVPLAHGAELIGVDVLHDLVFVLLDPLRPLFLPQGGHHRVGVENPLLVQGFLREISQVVQGLNALLCRCGRTELLLGLLDRPTRFGPGFCCSCAVS